MPKVTDSTQRYLVKALVPNPDGSFELVKWYASSYAHMARLHPSFESIPPSFWKHAVRYKHEDGGYRGRKLVNNRGIYVERLNFIMKAGSPLRRKKAA
jgi:hypothetical protein